MTTFMSKGSTGIKLLVTFLVALLALGLFQVMGSQARIDLTEHSLYTLSEGTQTLVDELERPVTLKLYFSEEGTREIVRLRNYARRVAELLTEIEASNPDKIIFEQINPEAFSEAEDEASTYGLNAAPVAPGQTVYFGLVAVPTTQGNGEDAVLVENQEAEIMPFLQPDREAFLEYDVAQLIHKVGNPEKPVIGLLSGLEINGGFDMMSRQPRQPWMSIQQMKSLFDVREIDESETSLPDNLDVLVLIQPKAPSDALLYAIDQFALNGGRVIAFIDPLANADQPNPMMGSEVIDGAAWNRLFHAWGVELNPAKVVGDMNLALMINQGQGQAPVRHVAIHNYGEENIARLPFTRQITQLNMATVGEWQVWNPGNAEEFEGESSGDTLETEVVKPSQVPDEKTLEHYEKLDTTLTPLISTTEESGLIDAEVFAPGASVEDITNEFQHDGEIRHIAVMMSGAAVSAFPEGFTEAAAEDADSEADSENNQDADEENLSDNVSDEAAGEAQSDPETTVKASQQHLVSGDINAILIADADMLTDYLWVQVMGQFRGQSIAQPFADNGDFLLNALEHLSGNKALMSIRSRGTYSRPFTKVEELRLAAEQRFREQEQALQLELEETEKKLAELQPTDQNTLELTQEQQQALLDFQQERLEIRKSLRNVNLQLNQDIRDLGLKIKALNIFLVPILLFIFAVVFFSMRQKQMERAKVSHLYNQ